MARTYDTAALSEDLVPESAVLWLGHVLRTYVSETNKVVAVWRGFHDGDLDYKPHDKSSSVRDVLKHQLLSERRFFAEFLGVPEAPASAVIPADLTVAACEARLTAAVAARLDVLAAQAESWWLAAVPFFDVERQRIWIFWRRLLHTAHHRAQLSVYLRLLGRRVPGIYGPTADEVWEGADPTTSVEAAGRR